MNTALIMAFDEWRFWMRSKLGAAAALLALILICTSVFATMHQLTSEREARQSLQLKAEETFRNQPARHPHRMVHYGHYVFRTPTPLAMLDPGVDPFAGTVMFLEGHHQNSAMFSPTFDGAQAGPFSRLTPALAYQFLVPLVLIIIGFGSVAREREAATDRQLVTSGISPATILLGKTLALLGVAGALFLPLIMGTALSGSLPSIGFGFSVLYAAYLVFWVFLITAVSTWSRSVSASLLVLMTLWTGLSVLAPRLVASAANVVIPTASRIETDMDVSFALRDMGDGHNVNDPSFNRLRANLLEEYGVERVEDLPVNFRGVVAQSAEVNLTEVMNEYAEKRMHNEAKQADLVRTLGFVSPFLALQSASMAVAGTDVRTHHRFLREAEAARFEFVQGLNKAHTEVLTYTNDINRSKDEASSKRARISAENWRVLGDFRFEPEPAHERLGRLTPGLLVLLIWTCAAALLGWLGARRLPEVDHG